jgi:hypothetical protein
MKMTKVCRICGEELSIDRFQKSRSRRVKSGVVYCYCCKDCYRHVHNHREPDVNRINEVMSMDDLEFAKKEMAWRTELLYG